VVDLGDHHPARRVHRVGKHPVSGDKPVVIQPVLDFGARSIGRDRRHAADDEPYPVLGQHAVIRRLLF
jgi:hypothetical protein